MPGKIYVERIELGTRVLFTVTFNPNGLLPGNAGDLAIRTDAPNGGIYVNTDGALAWNDLGATGPARPIRVPVGNVAGVYDSATAIPAGAVVINAQIKVDTAYDGGATITIGTPAAPGAFQGVGNNVPSSTNLYLNAQQTDVAAPGVVRVTLGGAPTVGAAVVLVEYVVPAP